MSNQFCSVEVGDLIYAYHKGIHKVIKIERRFCDASYITGASKAKVGDEYSSLVHYEKVANDNNTLVKEKEPRQYACDARFCSKINGRTLLAELIKLTSQYHILIKFADEHYNNANR